MCIEGGNDLDGIDDAFEVTGLEWKVGGVSGPMEPASSVLRLDWRERGKGGGRGGPGGKGGWVVSRDKPGGGVIPLCTALGYLYATQHTKEEHD